MAGSITEEDRDFVETWEHISAQRWGIIRLDPRGDTRDEVIMGRRTFKLTSEERIITQDAIRDKKNDPFLNGSFRPIVVPDSVTVESNPNALSDEEIERILASSDIAWRENLSVIDSVATIRRMLEIAEELDTVSLRRYRELESRLSEVRQQVRIQSNDPALQKFLNDRPSPASDSEDASSPTRRNRGGMSSTYR